MRVAGVRRGFESSNSFRRFGSRWWSAGASASLFATILTTGVSGTALASEPTVSGVIADAAGHPAAGQIVQLYATPSGPAKRAAPDGTVPTELLSATSTNAQGQYELLLPSQATVATWASPSGEANLELVTFGPAGQTTYDFAMNLRDLAGATGARSIASRSTSSPVPAVLGVLANTAPGPVGNVALKDIPPICQTFHSADYGVATTTVGDTYSTYAYAEAQFTYHQGATSTLGVGVSGQGTFGTFSAGGTSTWSSGATIGWAKQLGVKFVNYNTGFSLSKYRTTCHYFGGRQTTTYAARVSGFAGGATAVYPKTRPTATQCTHYDPGAFLQKDRTAERAFQTGFHAGPKIGADLSAATGWTSAASVTYTFRKAGHMCGVWTYAASVDPSPGQIVATP
jgi:hypothetical protein